GGSINLQAKMGIGQVGSPIRIANDNPAIFVTNTTANDVVLNLLSGGWFLDGSYMSVSNTGAPGGLIDLTAQTGNIDVASSYALSSPNGSVSLTALGNSPNSGTITVASGSSVNAPSGNVSLFADNISLAGAAPVSAPTGTVTLAPTDPARAIKIESSPTGGLSLSPSVLATIPAGTL